MNFVPRFFIVPLDIFMTRYLHGDNVDFASFLPLDTIKKNDRIIIAYKNFDDYSLYYKFNSSFFAC